MEQDSLIVAIDSNNQPRLIPKGETKTRTSSYAIVPFQESLLLIKNKQNGLYWFPGGTLEIDETPQEAAIWETYEETGIQIKIISRISTVESYHHWSKGGITYHQSSHFFLAEALSTTIDDTLNPDTTDDAAEPAFVKLATISPDQCQDYAWSVIEKVWKQYES